MLTSGDVVGVELGVPEGSEAGMTRPAVVVTAQAVLDAGLTEPGEADEAGVGQ